MPYVGRDEYYEEPLAGHSMMWADFYAFTMGQALFLEGRHEQIATFQAFVRELPFGSAFMIAAGQNILFEWLDKNWKLSERSLKRLADTRVVHPTTGETVPVFVPEYLEYLRTLDFKCTIDAMAEGEIAFNTEAVIKSIGPIIQLLIIEGAVLNTMNPQSLFATHGARLKEAARGKPVIEGGLRRAQDIGGLSPTRGGYIGGLDATSNCLAGEFYDLPLKGTMAHAYVMSHETERLSFEAWATTMPHIAMFLPDTYNTKNGIDTAISVSIEKGIVPAGVRHDSGDLAYYSTMGREAFDSAGFFKASNMASNDLDVLTIHSLENQNAPINGYLVGTAQATAKDQPALGGVYKIANIYENGVSHDEIDAMKEAVKAGRILPEDIRDHVRDVMKLAAPEHAIKMTYPGEMDVIRFLKEDGDGRLYFDGDVICSDWVEDPLTFDDPADPMSGRLNRDIVSVRRDNNSVSKTFNIGSRAYRPLRRYFDKGVLVGNIETVHIAKARVQEQLSMLEPSHKRIDKPHRMVVGVEKSLLMRQTAMAAVLRQTGNAVLANKVS